MEANCMIQFVCVQQELERSDDSVVAADAAGTVGAHFTLCEKWDGLTVYARFQHMAAVYDVALDGDGCAVIPWEVLREPGFCVSLFGTGGDGARLTSARVFVCVEPSIGYEGAEPIPPTKTLLERFEEDAAAARSIAQSVRDDADAGKLAGVPGPPGPGVPEGGTALQTLRKTADNTETEWADANDHEHDAAAITSGTLAAERLPTIPITRGGTGAIDEQSARQNLNVIGQNPISTPDEDTVEAWAACGTGVAFIHSAGHITGQPSEYGLIISSVFGSEVHQIWQTQPSGSLYHRGGNSSGWSGSWHEFATVEGIAEYIPWSIETGGTGASSALGAADSLQVESIGDRTALTASSNLDALMTIGSYTCASDSVADAMASAPVSVAFTLTVSSRDGDTSSAARVQELVTMVDGGRYRRSCNSSGSWGSWKKTPMISDTSVTLDAGSWSDLAQTVSASGVTAANDIVVAPAADSFEDWGKCGVYATTQQSGSISFACRVAPSVDLVANILIFN